MKGDGRDGSRRTERRFEQHKCWVVGCRVKLRVPKGQSRDGIERIKREGKKAQLKGDTMRKER